MTTTHKDEYNLGELEPSLIQQEYAPVIFAQDTIEHVISLDMLTGKEDRENVMRARELGKDLYALRRYVGAKDRTNGTNDEESERRPAQLQDQLPSNEPGDGAAFEESNQEVFDCINARIIPPIEDYMVGKVLSPHLSPFVDNEAQGHVPEYGDSIRGVRLANHLDAQPHFPEHLFNQDSFLGHIDRLEEDNVFEIVHVKVVDELLQYSVYNSQHQVWASQELMEVPLNVVKGGDQKNATTIIENGFRYVLFLGRK
nr:pescadillo homolog [Tanacetum cinerariifolium]